MFSLFKKIIIKTNLNEQEIIKIISETEKSSRETHNDDSCHSDYYKIAIIGENFSIKRVLPEGHGGDIGLIPIMQGKIYDSNIELTFRPKIPDLIAALIVIAILLYKHWTTIWNGIVKISGAVSNRAIISQK